MGFPFLAYELLTKHKNLLLGPNAPTKKKCLMFGRAKMSLSRAQIDQVVMKDSIHSDLLQGWADPFLKDFGYEWVGSLDYSAFEGAGYIWNLNKPLGNASGELAAELSTIDLILDYGTSEHVFNPAMSICNASILLNKGGYLNVALPLHGFCDHGLFQFSPSFFYAIDSPEFRLEALYFVVHDAKGGALMVWDGLSNEFREHVHGAFDGSFAANCLPLLNEKIMAWALFKKMDLVEQDEFMYNTQQPIYKEQWVGHAITSSGNAQKLAMYNLDPKERYPRLIQYIKSIALSDI